MEYLKHYDSYVINDDLEEAVADVQAIMRGAHHRVDDAEAILKKMKGE